MYRQAHTGHSTYGSSPHTLPLRPALIVALSFLTVNTESDIGPATYLESLFSTCAFFARMLAEGLALTLTISHPASSRAARDYAGTRRERKLGCGWAALESLFSTSAFFA